MFFKAIHVGNLQTNCYILGCKETKECLVIDPGDEGERILNIIEQEGYKLEKVINTHGHWDHIGANFYLKSKTNAKIYIHEDDAAFLRDENLSLMSWVAKGEKTVDADEILKDGDTIKLGLLNLKVIHTPGHTPGGISLQVKNLLFTGDTLFAGSIGRTDLPGGDYDEIIKSLKTKLAPLDDNLEVYPGHGPKTTLGYEKSNNPFF